MTDTDTIKNLHKTVIEQLQQLNHYSPLYPVYQLEARFTLMQLDRILSKNIDPEATAKKLIRFLDKRWYWIKNTDISYLHDFINPANIAAIAIAQTLSSETTPYLTLLIPTLITKKPKITYISSHYADNPSLKESIMLFNNRCLLNINDCIDFSINDGQLKANFLINGKNILLTQQQIELIFSRHQSIRDAYHATKEKVNFTYYTNSIGAAINRLILGLRGGGEHANGKKYDSGEIANLAILEFSQFLEMCAPDLVNQIMSVGVYDRFDEGTLSQFGIQLANIGALFHATSIQII